MTKTTIERNSRAGDNPYRAWVLWIERAGDVMPEVTYHASRAEAERAIDWRAIDTEERAMRHATRREWQ